jgi:oxygen-dependent protoporphyrinogen oxidase
MSDVTIIGGGISGLSTAYYLARSGISSTILETRPRLGGVIQTEFIEGCTVEGGPDSFLAAKPEAMELIRELGLADSVIESNDHLRITYVRRNGRLIPLPDGMMMMVPTKIMPIVTTRLLSWGAKIRMGFELFHSPKSNAGDLSVAEFVEQHYGSEAVEYLAEPLLSGVYGGDPRELSVNSVLPRFVDLATKYGSLTRGMLAEIARRKGAKPGPLFRSLKGGMGQLVDAIAAAVRGKVDVRNVRAETVERDGAGFRIRAGGDWMAADRLVIACEAHNAAKLLSGVDGRLGELLGQVGYNSSTMVALGFDAVARPADGFGFLVPKKERQRVVACTWVGTKFPHRVPQGKVLARCFLSGADEPDVNAVAGELREISGFTAEPRFSRVFQWQRAMAQYTVGHAARVSEIAALTAAIPGLHLAGNAYQGIGIPDCIRTGKQAAEKIAGRAARDGSAA